MRRTPIVLLLAIAACCAPGAATAAAKPSITVTPHAGKSGDRVYVRGRNWAPRNEFCRAIYVSILGVHVARSYATDKGTMLTWFRIPEPVGSGKRTVVVSQTCESGQDGSLHTMRAQAVLTVS